MTHVMEGETTRGRNDSGWNDSGRTGKWAKQPVTCETYISQAQQILWLEANVLKRRVAKRWFH